jgi:hypothetical protein
VAVGVGVGVAVGTAVADVAVELDEDAVGAVDDEPHAASEMAASPASNGTNLRGVMALPSW